MRGLQQQWFVSCLFVCVSFVVLFCFVLFLVFHVGFVGTRSCPFWFISLLAHVCGWVVVRPIRIYNNKNVPSVIVFRF